MTATPTFATAADGTKLYVEEAGAGAPVLFVHEFAGDHRSWEPQVRAFSRRFRCIVYAARGYPPSHVPSTVSSYSQDLAVTDALAVLDHLGIDRAHVVGLSMGGFTSLHLGLRHPGRTRSVVAAGVGYGAHPDAIASFREEAEAIAATIEAAGPVAFAERYAEGPARVQFQNKDPRGWAQFAAQLAEHSGPGAANTMRGVQRMRPSLYDLREDLGRMQVPTLLIVGDEDEGCLDANLMLKRTIPSAGLVVLPRTGHTSNLEEPELFSRLVVDFVATVDAGRWGLRDRRSISKSTTGITDPGAARPKEPEAEGREVTMGNDAARMDVQDVMTRSVTTVAPQTSFQEILRLMAEHAISGVPVVNDEGRLIGIVTEADLLRDGAADRERTRALDWLLHPGRSQEAHERGHTAGDIMTSPVVTVRPTTSIWEAIRTLQRAGVKRLPVVEDDDRVVGIVSRVDLLGAFIRSDEEITEDVRSILGRILATDLHAVEVRVRDGRMSLAGSIDHAAQRDVIVDLVRRIPGVLEVSHSLEVAHEGGGEIPFAPIQPPGEDAGPRVDV